MQIIDAQIHTWGTGLPSNDAHWQITSFTPGEAIALMDEAGVFGAVIHPPGWDPRSTEMAFDAVRTWPDRFAIMGSLPLDRPDETRARLTAWRSQPGMLGLRWAFLHDPARRWLADGALDWLWAAAEKAQVPVAMLCTDSLADVGRIAERHPGLRLTVDHLGGRGGYEKRKDAAAMTHIPDLVELARHPTSPSRPRVHPATRAAPTPTPACTPTFARSSMRSDPSACSGAPTSPRCPAPGSSA